MNSIKLDCNFYEIEFGGTLVPPNSFKRLKIKAIYYLKQFTFNRCVDTKFEVEVKLALCEMIDKLYTFEKDGGIKTSESVGKHSVSFKVQDNTTLEKELYKIALIYLADTGLLFRGV